MMQQEGPERRDEPIAEQDSGVRAVSGDYEQFSPSNQLVREVIKALEPDPSDSRLTCFLKKCNAALGRYPSQSVVETTGRRISEEIECTVSVLAMGTAHNSYDGSMDPIKKGDVTAERVLLKHPGRFTEKLIPLYEEIVGDWSLKPDQGEAILKEVLSEFFIQAAENPVRRWGHFEKRGEELVMKIDVASVLPHHTKDPNMPEAPFEEFISYDSPEAKKWESDSESL